MRATGSGTQGNGCEETWGTAVHLLEHPVGVRKRGVETAWKEKVGGFGHACAASTVL